MSTDFLEGGSLSRRAAKTGRIPFEEAETFFGENALRAASGHAASTYGNWKKGEPKKGLRPGVPWSIAGPLLLHWLGVEHLSQLKGSRGGQVIVEGTAEEMHEYAMVQQGVLDLFYRKQRNEPGAEELWSVIVSAVKKKAATKETARPGGQARQEPAQ